MRRNIVIGTRGSDLALWQAHFLQRELQHAGYASELKIIKTKGDQIQHLSLEKLEGKGFFTKEIEDALLERTTDIAVHSHKDLPTAPAPGLIIAGVSYREDPSELLLIRKDCADPSKELHLAEHAIVGTSSSRRTLQLLFYRPDLQLKDIRGNVPTRIEKLRRGDFDAILLAQAGVARLNLDISDLHVLKIKPQQIIPAPAQGVLAYQCREDDDEMISILKSISHDEVTETIAVEREVMRLFQGGCHMPLGIYCEKSDDGFNIWAMQSAGRGEVVNRLWMKTDAPALAAHKIFQALKTKTSRSVFITTHTTDDAPFLKLLHAKGFSVTCNSLLDIQKIEFTAIPDCDWIFFTSKNGVNHFFDQWRKEDGSQKFAAIGEETAAEIRKKGYMVDFVGEGEADDIAAAFLKRATGTTVLFPQALNASTHITNKIAASAKITILPVYANKPSANIVIPDSDIVVFTSVMNVEVYLAAKQIQPHQIIVAIGNTTRNYLNDRGIAHVLTPPHKNMVSIADLICGLDLPDH